jgi:DNA polymerase I
MNPPSLPGYDMDVADDSKTEKKTSDLEGDKPDNLAGLIDEVQTVETVEEAKRVLGVLMSNLGSADRPIYHAVDTEAS